MRAKDHSNASLGRWWHLPQVFSDNIGMSESANGIHQRELFAVQFSLTSYRGVEHVF